MATADLEASFDKRCECTGKVVWLRVHRYADGTDKFGSANDGAPSTETAKPACERCYKELVDSEFFRSQLRLHVK